VVPARPRVDNTHVKAIVRRLSISSLEARTGEALSIADAEKRKTVMADIERYSRISASSSLLTQLYNHSVVQ
jgi:histone H3/H4